MAMLNNQMVILGKSFIAAHSAKIAIWTHVGLSKTGRYPEMAVLTGT